MRSPPVPRPDSPALDELQSRALGAALSYIEDTMLVKLPSIEEIEMRLEQARSHVTDNGKITKRTEEEKQRDSQYSTSGDRFSEVEVGAISRRIAPRRFSSFGDNEEDEYSDSDDSGLGEAIYSEVAVLATSVSSASSAASSLVRAAGLDAGGSGTAAPETADVALQTEQTETQTTVASSSSSSSIELAK